jgi:hypothetical protein
MVLPVAPFFDLGVDFDVFLFKNMGFLCQSSCFEVTVLVKSVTLFCNNNNFDANIGRYGMNFKNDKPNEGPHSAVVEYCFPHISVFPSTFLKQN